MWCIPAATLRLPPVAVYGDTPLAAPAMPMYSLYDIPMYTPQLAAAFIGAGLAIVHPLASQRAHASIASYLCFCEHTAYVRS